MKREENWFLKPPPHTPIFWWLLKKKVWEVQNFYEFLSVNSSVCLHAEIFNFAATAKLNFDSFFIFSPHFCWNLIKNYWPLHFVKCHQKKFHQFLQFCRETVPSDKRWKIVKFLKILKIAQKNEKRLGCVLNMSF